MKRKRKQTIPKSRQCPCCSRRYIPEDRRKRNPTCPYCGAIHHIISISQLKKEAWRVFSEYIRRRDADVSGCCSCITCGEVGPWTAFQAGHFLDGRTKGILFDENCVHAQCRRCNITLHGNKDRYWIEMLKRYGVKELDEMVSRKNSGGVWTKGELIGIIAFYRSRIERMV